MWKKIKKTIKHDLINDAICARPYYKTYGLIIMMTYLAFYFLNLVEIIPGGYENLPLRVCVLLVGLFWACYDCWAKKLLSYVPLLWHLTLCFTLPFFFFFMLFKNPAGSAWESNALFSLLVLALFLSWYNYAIIIILGSFFAWLAYFLTTSNIEPPLNLYSLICNYTIAIFYFVLFLQKRQKVQDEKLSVMKAMTAAIANEMRTPLLSISFSAEAIKKNLPPLMKAYDIARTAKLECKELSAQAQSSLKRCPDQLEKVTRRAFSIIDLLVGNVMNLDNPQALQNVSIKKCVEQALEQYPLHPKERELIYWDGVKDFIFQGQENMLIHILFNLLKNALHYIQVAGKGDIHIWTEEGKKHYQLHFKDTGAGISEKMLPHIFEQFYTKTKYGAGIGLFFCQKTMEEIGGRISCESTEGEYAKFILEFPKKSS